MMLEDDAEMRLRVRLDYRQFIDDLNSKKTRRRRINMKIMIVCTVF